MCKSTLWNKLSKNGQLIVDWRLCERLVCATFYPGGRGEGEGTWLFFGWVCAARDSKLAPRSKTNFP